MAREVFTVAGQAIGYYFGGPIGAAIGSYIGMSIGYAVDPLDPQYGPRLEDRRVQTSAYGQQVPLLYGVVRVSGNVIWAEDLEEVQTSEDVGGKGGPSQEVISYSYFGTFAVMLGRGQLRGIRRIWADTVLIHDATTNIDNPGSEITDFVFYSGSENQDPDPLIEASVGIGNTPAYRGYSYVVFNRLPLERFGNRLPSLSFEINGDGLFRSDLPVTYLGQGHPYRWQSMRQRADGKLLLSRWSGAAKTLYMAIADPITGELLLQNTWTVPYGMGASFYNSMCYVPPTNELWLFIEWYDGNVYPSTFECYIIRLDAETLEPVAEPIPADNGISGNSSKENTYYDKYANAVNTMAYSQFTSNVFQQFDLDGNLTGDPVDAYDWFCQGLTGGAEFCCIAEGYEWFAVLQNKGVENTVFDGDMYTTKLVGQGTVLAALDVPGTTTFLSAWDPNRKRYVIVGNDAKIWTVDDSPTPTIVYQGSFDYAPILVAVDEMLYHPDLDAFITKDGRYITVFDAETFEVKLTMNLPGSTDTVPHDMRVSSARPNSIVVAGQLNTSSGFLYDIPLYGTTVGDAVASMLDESGYTIADYDVSELTDLLRGFRVMRLGPLRQAIEQLATVYYFEGCEQDDQLVFKKRGRASSATYALTDLVIDGPNDLPLKSARAQESSLPKRLTLTAPDPYTDHQPGAQQAERWTVPAGQDEQFSVDVVMSSTEAKRAADAIMFDRWMSRITASFKIGTPASRLTFGDVVTIDSKRYRIIGRSMDLFTLSYEVVADDPDVITQNATGAQGTFPGQVVATVISSGMVVVDSALLRTADDKIAAYVAVYPLGSSTSWRGAVVYSSVDSGANWSNEAIMPTPGTKFGLATNVLGNFTGGEVFDETNKLIVNMRNGVPTSSTRATLLNSDTNAAAVRSGSSWEIIQFRSVTNNGDGTYTLSGLLRGRRGTEYAISGHAIGDEFVVLDPATIREIEIENSQIGVAQRFKPVTVRQTIDAANYQVSAINAVRLKPWAPVDLRAARNTVDSDIVYTWKRRSRWQTRFTGGGGINVPASDTPEVYIVEVYSASASPTFVRTVTVTSPTWTYTTAAQTADGHTLGSAATLKIYQVSAVVGRGFPLEDTK